MGCMYGKRVGGLLLALFLTVCCCVRSSAVDAKEDREREGTDRIQGSFIFTGTGEGLNANGLQGMEFELSRQDGNGTYIEVSDETYETDKKGHIVLNGLCEGKYRLKAVKVPQGYGLNKAFVPFEIQENGKAGPDGRNISGHPVKGTLQVYLLPAAPEIIEGSEGMNDEAEEAAVMGGETLKNSTVQQKVWIIYPFIPSDIAVYKIYQIGCELDEGLKYAGTKVWIGGKADRREPDITDKCGIKQEAGRITIDLTECQNDISGREVAIQVTADVIEADAYDKEEFQNIVSVSYANAWGAGGYMEIPQDSTKE